MPPRSTFNESRPFALGDISWTLLLVLTTVAWTRRPKWLIPFSAVQCCMKQFFYRLDFSKSTADRNHRMHAISQHGGKEGLTRTPILIKLTKSSYIPHFDSLRAEKRIFFLANCACSEPLTRDNGLSTGFGSAKRSCSRHSSARLIVFAQSLSALAPTQCHRSRP